MRTEKTVFDERKLANKVEETISLENPVGLQGNQSTLKIVLSCQAFSC